MFELFILLGVLSALTLIAAFAYGRRIIEATKKYSEAKRVIDDIILSFNRQLRDHERILAASVRKIGALSSRGNTLVGQVESQQKEFQALAEKVEALPTLEKPLARIDALENRVKEAVSIKEELLQRILELESKRPHQKESEAKIEAAIPIKREKALAPLTETELAVLEFLVVEGERTAPEIKGHIKLSREHTARLMKKLYEKGYLERSANRVPFTYRLKDEMQRILRKPEQKS